MFDAVFYCVKGIVNGLALADDPGNDVHIL